jgi:hypothetical protein
MAILVLLVLAALGFSILAGVAELGGARRARRRLLNRASPVLHPLAQHPLPRSRFFTSRRAFHHVGLFFGFLLAIYVGMVLVRAAHAILAHWF